MGRGGERGDVTSRSGPSGQSRNGKLNTPPSRALADVAHGKDPKDPARLHQHRRDARYRPWFERTERPAAADAPTTWDPGASGRGTRPGAAYAAAEHWESGRARPSMEPRTQPGPGPTSTNTAGTRVTGRGLSGFRRGPAAAEALQRTATWDDLVPRAAEAARPGAPGGVRGGVAGRAAVPEHPPRPRATTRSAAGRQFPRPSAAHSKREVASPTPAPGGSGEPRKKRSVATWVAQEGSSPPRGYCSSAPWKAQLRIEPSLPLELVPGVFRGHTPRDYLARFPNGVVAPDPLATYCSDCGVLLVSETKHRALTGHGPDLEDGGDPTSVAAMRARMQRDPAYRAAILAPPAGSGNAVGPGVPTEEGGVPAARPGRSPVAEAPPARPNPEALRLWEGSPSCEAAVLQPAPAQHEEANASSDGDADMLDLGCGEPDDTDEHAARLQKLLEEPGGGMKEGIGFPSTNTLAGLRVTFYSTKALLKYLTENVGFRYLMASHLSQDCLERSFGIVRQASGANDHPTPAQFIVIIRDACLVPRDCVPEELQADASTKWDFGGLLYPSVSLYRLIQALESSRTQEFSRTQLHSKAAFEHTP
ncbi:hypothetical protein HPB48_000588 [Haemaphysalis longicornis]|uniref:Transposable element P transposase-like RNase H C-terminal domain-containing protein n=1 Tax=Haemaphysalis longicornis TaxID=44386 RepID=A0A9J6FD69_HAELO|nr:hypothetical protein HPB48_000588 [Haemaphysalis longicornis]